MEWKVDFTTFLFSLRLTLIKCWQTLIKLCDNGIKKPYKSVSIPNEVCNDEGWSFSTRLRQFSVVQYSEVSRGCFLLTESYLDDIWLIKFIFSLSTVLKLDFPEKTFSFSTAYWNLILFFFIRAVSAFYRTRDICYLILLLGIATDTILDLSVVIWSSRENLSQTWS